MTTWKEIEQTVAQAVERGDFPSAAIGIGSMNRVYVQAAFGKTSITEEGQPVSARTLYDMASLTKVMATTMVAFYMIEHGMLRLNDKIGDFMPAPVYKKDVTIYQLMTHTGGFQADFKLEMIIKNPEDAVNCILRRPLVNPPGKKVVYSCMGYIILGKILEIVGGKSLDEMAREWVFEPLGMTSTGYRPYTDLTAALDVGRTEDIAWTEYNAGLKRYITGVVHDENARFMQGVAGNAGVFSNLEDMMKFGRMLARGGDGYLSRAMMKLATQNYTPGQDQHRGLGFQIKDNFSFFGDLMGPDSFGHNGYTGISLAVDPQSGLYVVLLTNRVHPSRDSEAIYRFRHLIHNMAAAAYTSGGNKK